MSDPLTLIHGDAFSSLRTLEDESVQTCVTSPPYWGLRSYGTEPLVWDNHNGCMHLWNDASPRRSRTADDCPNSPKQLTNNGTQYEANGGGFCQCGAWRGELGLEPTPELYVSHLVQIFREVKRVLRKDGTLWLNLGDSYCASGPGNKPDWSTSGLHGATTSKKYQGTLSRSVQTVKDKSFPGLKPKDLVGIPWLTAFALRADGWYLRSDIIWSKPNPMPESVTDRPTKSHEYIFLLSKSQRYYYDQDAVRESHVTGNRPDKWDGRSYVGKGSATGDERHNGNVRAYTMNLMGRNIRSVWAIATQPFSDAHFATFPPDLIKPCVLAGAPIGGVVLDPFAGSGTTGKVAIELGRKAILIEPKAEYVEMIKKRCQTTIGLPLAI